MAQTRPIQQGCNLCDLILKEPTSSLHLGIMSVDLEENFVISNILESKKLKENGYKEDLIINLQLLRILFDQYFSVLTWGIHVLAGCWIRVWHEVVIDIIIAASSYSKQDTVVW